MHLERAGHETLVQRLHQQLRSAILERRIAAGVSLPATRRVASAYGVSRNTVVAAYDLLMAEGYLITRAGAKAVVADVGQMRQTPSRKATVRQASRLAPDWHQRAPGASRSIEVSTAKGGFQLGVPDHRHLPLTVWRRLLGQTSRLSGASAFDYPSAEGPPLLRAAIAQHIAYARAVVCSADDIVVTSGAQQAFDLLARILVTSGRTKVAVEDPGYPPLRAAMLAAGAQLVAIPVDEEGMIVERLPLDVRVVYVTPSHQFPTGVVMSMQRRLALLNFARTHGAVIIEDDYDGEFRYGAQPLDALQTLDRDGSVVYVGTFSKSLFPSLRIGYLVAPPWACDALAWAKRCADAAGNVQLHETLARFILDGHLARHVRSMRKHYAARREAMLDALQLRLGDWFDAIPAQAGIHLCARYRRRNDASRLLPHVRRFAAGAQPVSDFLFESDTRAAAGIAFGFGCIEADEIDVSLSRLAQALGW
ncbi:PLP-dependent aminotransferase family protein [Trinickia sp. LjRoot230]|uniref:MocR-like pyridoxine biosynthesis transcription factor PdxR n=1 Tax=Trinickia sp. LjRoot230 TaxID=3342288 RepID=UPI003ED04548